MKSRPPVSPLFDTVPPDFSFSNAPNLNFDSLPASPVTTMPAGRTLGVRPCRMTRRPTRRRFFDMRGQIDAANRLVRPLPMAGESVHCLLDGSFVLAAIVPAVLEQLAQPAALTVSTLGLNDATVDPLCRELDARRLTRCNLVLSHYFA
jgi:hypothetical protein